MPPRDAAGDPQPPSLPRPGLLGAEWLAWGAVGLWSLCIFTAIPLARDIQKSVSEQWGRSTFGWVVIAAITAAAIAAITWVSRKGTHTASRAGALWLALTAAVFFRYTVELWKNPEETIHFIQYGVLGVLLHFALRHRLQDTGIYFTAAAMGAIVGIVDEAIQWLTPQRVWGVRDIWLNFFACALVQVAIAKGIRPMEISGPPGPRSVRWICRTLTLALLLLASSLLNTPSRTRWYVDRLPGLPFLVSNAGVMAEYGYLYDDPETGRFRSRLAPDELRSMDAERAAEAAAVIDQYRDDEAYGAFLARYTPASDPFIHEVRVHLFRRDRYLHDSSEHSDDEYKRRLFLSVAYYENLILEKYFGETLRRSQYVLGPGELTRIEAGLLPDWDHESGVSLHLFTSLTERGVVLSLFPLLLLLFGIDRRYGRVREKR